MLWPSHAKENNRPRILVLLFLCYRRSLKPKTPYNEECSKTRVSNYMFAIYRNCSLPTLIWRGYRKTNKRGRRNEQNHKSL
eukprot:Seg2369.7 transcript_id=Seg2369.7/GoldUCD/mRNA.D3Y31 product="hypothetical protein" pseudo=true protein_id=Seg2369.7/GoldUCD/D3Y31